MCVLAPLHLAVRVERHRLSNLVDRMGEQVSPNQFVRVLAVGGLDCGSTGNHCTVGAVRVVVYVARSDEAP
jgi:hypothetical protein